MRIQVRKCKYKIDSYFAFHTSTGKTENECLNRYEMLKSYRAFSLADFRHFSFFWCSSDCGDRTDLVSALLKSSLSFTGFEKVGSKLLEIQNLFCLGPIPHRFRNLGRFSKCCKSYAGNQAHKCEQRTFPKTTQDWLTFSSFILLKFTQQNAFLF